MLARVIANPTSADVLDALFCDQERSVGSIASEIGSARSTVSEAVSSLTAAGLVARRRRGRLTLVRLAGDQVAEALEALGRLAEPPKPIGLRAVSRMEALRRARTCYDHLAGELGVRLADQLLSRDVLVLETDGAWTFTEKGHRRLLALGLDPALIASTGRRPLVRACTDWTEHRPHVAGRLGAAICTQWLQTGIVCRLPNTRAVRSTPAVDEWLERL